MTVSLLTIAALSTGTAFAAAPDLTTSITTPAVVVEADGTYSVKVSNIGNASAFSVALSIQLPVTHTSPTVHVLGDLGTMSPSCSQTGTKLNCSLGTIKRGKSSTVTFVLAVPWSLEPIDFSATATTSGESNTGNNGSTGTANVSYYSNSVADGSLATNEHCTGTNLISFFECELYPSSISSHEHIFEAGGIISIPGYPDYSGSWSHPGGDTSKLVFEYTELGAPVANFEGNGVTGGCYDGNVEFTPASTYNAPYHVCF